jgi:hypothetical protein
VGGEYDEYDEDDDNFRAPRPWPLWVSLGLWGCRAGRGPGAASGSAVAGFFYWPAFFGVLFVFAALW